MIRDNHQRARMCRALLAPVLPADEYFNDQGPTQRGLAVSAPLLSSGERILLALALALWNGSGRSPHAPRIDALWQLDDQCYRRVLAVLDLVGRPADEIDEGLAALEGERQ